MNQRISAPARVLAAIALLCGVLLFVVVVATSLSGGGGSTESSHASGQVGGRSRRRGPVPKSYVVQSGDTLTAIAHKTGVPVVRIQRLNPGVDPQILISGEKLKLR